MEGPLTLIILTPRGEAARLSCDSVTFFAKDNSKGENGGSMGVRRGHIAAAAALEPDTEIRAFAGGSMIAAFRVTSGFAMVKDDVVTAAVTLSESE